MHTQQPCFGRARRPSQPANVWMNCSRSQLDAVPLDRADLRESRVGVHGCGRQATYVRLYNLWGANTSQIEEFQEEQFRRSNAGIQMNPSR